MYDTMLQDVDLLTPTGYPQVNGIPPKVIVTVPTADGKLDKLIHISSEKFDNLAVRDQAEHSKLMKQRIASRGNLE